MAAAISGGRPRRRPGGARRRPGVRAVVRRPLRAAAGLLRGDRTRARAGDPPAGHLRRAGPAGRRGRRAVRPGAVDRAAARERRPAGRPGAAAGRRAGRAPARQPRRPGPARSGRAARDAEPDSLPAGVSPCRRRGAGRGVRQRSRRRRRCLGCRQERCGDPSSQPCVAAPARSGSPAAEAAAGLQRASVRGRVCVVDLPSERSDADDDALAAVVASAGVPTVLVGVEPLRSPRLWADRRVAESPQAMPAARTPGRPGPRRSPTWPTETVDDLAARFALPADDVAAVAALDRTASAWAVNGSRPTLDQLAARVSRPRSARLATIRTPRRGRDAARAPGGRGTPGAPGRRGLPGLATGRRDLAARPLRHAGITALFAGEPGTGKTLAAEVIAGEVGLDLMVVDLSLLVSKWIGETEKNLDAVFTEAGRVALRALLRRGRHAVRTPRRDRAAAPTATRTSRSATCCSGSTATTAWSCSPPTCATTSTRRSPGGSSTWCTSRARARPSGAACGSWSSGRRSRSTSRSISTCSPTLELTGAGDRGDRPLRGARRPPRRTRRRCEWPTCVSAAARQFQREARLVPRELLGTATRRVEDDRRRARRLGRARRGARRAHAGARGRSTEHHRRRRPLPGTVFAA